MSTSPGRIPDATLDDIRARLPVTEMVGRLTRLKRTGRAWRGACPLCHSTSSALIAEPQKFHCFKCGSHGDCFRWLMLTEGCDFRQAVLRCAAEAGVDLEGDPGERRVSLPPPPPRDPARDDAARMNRAAETWSRAVPIEAGSAQARYLEGRGLWPLPPAAHDVLRAIRLRYPADRDEDGKVASWPAGQGVHPVMIARVSAPGRKVCAVHVTFLAAREDGSVGKLAVDDDHASKLVWGALPEGAAIRLAPPAEAMGCAEGIETALAASALFDGLAVWATISAGGMARWVPPKACRAVTIFADRDKPRLGRVWRPEGEGLHVARQLQDRLRARDVAARIRVPVEPAGDYADVLLAMRRAA